MSKQLFLFPEMNLPDAPEPPAKYIIARDRHIQNLSLKLKPLKLRRLERSHATHTKFFPGKFYWVAEEVETTQRLPRGILYYNDSGSVWVNLTPSGNPVATVGREWTPEDGLEAISHSLE